MNSILLLLALLLSVPAFDAFLLLPGPPRSLRQHQHSFLSVLSSDEELSSSTTVASPINEIIESRRKFELQLGKTIDTLNADYPELLKAPPTYDIYNQRVSVVDPSGVEAIRGLEQYKNMFGVLRMAAGFFYSTTNSFIEHKLVYDWVRSQIRVSFKITLVKGGRDDASKISHQQAMEAVLGTRASAKNDHTVVSGISEYFVDADGKIVKHVISNIVINDKPVTIGLGMGDLFNLQQGRIATNGAGGMSLSVPPTLARRSTTIPGFQKSLRLGNQRHSAARQTLLRLYTVSPSASDDQYDLEKSFAEKNEARVKFGLKPITFDEYKKILTDNADLGNHFQSQQQMKEEEERLKLNAASGKPANPINIFSSVLSAILPKDMDAPKTCETFEDCDNMECCDLIVAKICCKTGLGSHAYMPDLIPVPIADPADADPRNPGQEGRGMRGPLQ